MTADSPDSEADHEPELPGPPRDEQNRRLPELSGRSREVLDVLTRQEGRAAHFYEGAIRSLTDHSNPVRAESAAYCLREVIEVLERVTFDPNHATTQKATRRDRAQMALSTLDPVKRHGPPDIDERRITKLVKFRSEFNGVLHDEEPADPRQFESTVGRFEAFLLAWFQPRTFDDFSQIDELLKEGPPT